MPIRKIADLPKPKKCRDPDHELSTHISLPPGIYEHECPSCGEKTTFVVDGGRLTVAARDGLHSRPIDPFNPWDDPAWDDSQWWRRHGPSS